MKKIFAFILVAFVAACASTSTRRAAQSKLYIALTSNRLSEIEPCGCSLGPLGGINREWNLLNSWETNGKNNLLYVAAGTTFMAPPDKYKAALKAHYQNKAGFVVEAFNRLGVDAVSPSVEDMKLGVETYQKLVKSSQFPWVSTNLYSTKTGEPLFQQMVKLRKADTDVYVFGISRAGKSLGVEVKNAEETLRPLFAALPQGRKFVVVLSSLDIKERDQLREKFPEINAFLGGAETSVVTAPLLQLSPGTLYVVPEARGRSVALLEVSLGQYPFAFYNEGEAARYREMGQVWQASLKDQESKLAQPSLNSRIRIDGEKQREKLSQSLSRIAPIPLEESANTSAVEALIINLDDKHEGEKNALSEVLEQYKASVRNLALTK